MNWIKARKVRLNHFLLLFIIFALYKANKDWLFVSAAFWLCIYLLWSWAKKNRVIYYFSTLVLVFLISIFFRIFVLEVFHIPSGSMENTLLIGDYVFVSKLKYGPILPKSIKDIPWLNLFFHTFNERNEDTEAPIYKTRLEGFSKVRKSDIVVFKLSNSSNQFLIKRCIALPGDTLEIIDSKIFTNGLLMEDCKGVKFIHEIQVRNANHFIHLLDSMKISYHENWFQRTQNLKEVIITQNQRMILEKRKEVEYIKAQIIESDSGSITEVV